LEKIEEAVLVLREHAEAVQLLLEEKRLRAVSASLEEETLDLLRLRRRRNPRRRRLALRLDRGLRGRLLPAGGAQGLIHALVELRDLRLHGPPVVLELLEVQRQPGELAENAQHGHRGVRARQLRRDRGHLPEQADRGQARLGRRGEREPVEARDLALRQDADAVAAQLGERRVVRGDAVRRRGAVRLHVRRHRREGEHARDAERPALGQQALAQRQLARRRLGLAEEDDDLALAVGVAPQEQAAARQARGVQESAADLHALELEEAPRAELGDLVHAGLEQQIERGRRTQLAEPRTSGPEPALGSSLNLRRGPA